MVIPPLVGQAEQARQVQAGVLIGELSTALESYKLDNGLYPTTEQGLNALVKPPVSTHDASRHSIERIPLDPWKNSFIYLSPGSRNDRNRGYDLISRGPDGIESDDDTIFPGYPDIFAAARQDDRIALQAFLDQKPDLIGARDREGNTPLFSALKEGSPETVKFLISRGADVTSDGLTPLKIAAGRGDREVLNLLKQCRAKE